MTSFYRDGRRMRGGWTKQGGAWIFPRRGLLLMMAMLLLLSVAMTGTGLAQNWRPVVRSDTFNEVFMVNATQGWAVGDAGLVARTNDGGLTWAYESTGGTQNFNGVWAASATDVWVVGAGGVVMRWNGSMWSLFNAGTTNNLNAIHGSSATNVWLVGESTTIRWNGTALQSYSSGTRHDVFAVSPTHVWAVGLTAWYRFDGTSWTTVGNGSVPIKAIHGVDANNLWAVGGSGRIMRWDGSAWATQSSGTTGNLEGVWAQDANNVWAVGAAGLVLKWNGGTWQTHSTGLTHDLTSVWGGGAGGVCATGTRGLLTQWDGTLWTTRTEGPFAVNFKSITAVDASHVWAASNTDGVWKWDGTRVRLDFKPTGAVYDVWAGSATDAWAVCSPDLVYRWNGTDWSLMNLGGSTSFAAVFGLDATNVWLVGTSGISKWNGSTLVSQSFSGSTPTNGFALDANNVWVVGQSGLISRWNGSSWTNQASGTTNTLQAVHALDASNAWAVGYNGTIRRWNGTAWSAQVSNTTTNLHGVWAQDVNNVWVTGESGVVGKWNGSAWVAAPDALYGTGYMTATSVHNMWASSYGMLLTTQPAAGPAPDLAVTVAGAPVADDGAAAPFAVTAAGETAQKVFTITNTGTDTLSGLALAKSGTAAADFALGSLGAVTLIPGASTTFAITFTAPATTPASAQVQISSNAPEDKSSYDIALSGQILSATADTDADGMNDAAELKLAALGFDWQTAQTALVSGYYAHAGTARLYDETQYNASRTAGQNDVLSAPNTHGLYTPTQVQALHAGTPLLQRNATTGEFTVTLGLQKSADLSHFSPFPVTVPQTTVNAQGQVELKFTMPDNTAFFRLQAQ